MSLTQGERITALETQVKALVDIVEKQDKKIDELLAIKNRGAGAFALASILFGTSIVWLFSVVTGWFK